MLRSGIVTFSLSKIVECIVKQTERKREEEDLIGRFCDRGSIARAFLSFRVMWIYGTRVRRLLDLTRGLFVCVMRNGDRLVASVCTPYGASQAANHGLSVSPPAANEIPFCVGFLFSICAPAVAPLADHRAERPGEKLERNFRRRSRLASNYRRVAARLPRALMQPCDASEVSITKSRQIHP